MNQIWRPPLLTWTKGTNQKITPHFYAHEFECPCDSPFCTTQIIDPTMVRMLDAIREELGAPLKVTSGYRCSNYQAILASKGYETAKGVSQHQLGMAADIAIIGPLQDGRNMVSLVNIASRHFKAIGVGKTFIHVDMRDDKVRRWSYNKRS